MDETWAGIFGIAFALSLAWVGWKHSEAWVESAKELRPAQVVDRCEKWTAKRPDAWQSKLWWAAAGAAKQGKRLSDAAGRYQERQRDAQDQKGDAEPKATKGGEAKGPAPEPASAPKPAPEPAPASPEGTPGGTQPAPAAEPTRPAPARGAPGRPAPALPTAPEPAAAIAARPTPPPVTAPGPTRPLPPGPAPAAPTTPGPPIPMAPPPTAPPLPTSATQPRPVILPAQDGPPPSEAAALSPIREFMGDNMSAITSGTSAVTATGAMAGVVRYIGELTGLSQVLNAWKQLLRVAEHDAQLTTDLTRAGTAYVAQSEALLERQRATQRILSALEQACYSNELEPAALAVVDQAMSANTAAFKAQVEAHQAIAMAIVAQQRANQAQQQSKQAILHAFQYMNRVHVAKRDVELATGARSSRNFSTT